MTAPDPELFEPPEVTDMDVAFGADFGAYRKVDVPREFYQHSNEWNRLASSLFFNGLEGLGLVFRKDVDPSKCCRFLGALLRSFAPRHEQKLATVGYLMSIWMEKEASS